MGDPNYYSGPVVNRLFQKLELAPPPIAMVSYQANLDESDSHEIACAYGERETLTSTTFESGTVRFERRNLATGSAKAITCHPDIMDCSVQFYDGERPVGTANTFTVDDPRITPEMDLAYELTYGVSLLLPCPGRPVDRPVLKVI